MRVDVNKKPVYLLAGGRGSDNAAIFRAVFKEISTPNPVIAYVGAANGDDTGFFKFMSSEIAKAEKCILKHAVLTQPKADIKKAREILEQADAVFMSGGDVEAGMGILESRGLISFFKELYRHGKFFFGSSAGSIMLAREWVRWKDPDNDATAEMFPCLSIAPVLIDTHAEEDDWEELKVAINLVGPSNTGYGIPKGACLKVYPDGHIEALGRPIAQFVTNGIKVTKLDIIANK